MRARIVRPGFWEDSLVGAMPDPVRLLYIGLWGLADDEGYLEWDLTAIAVKLYGFQRGSTLAKANRVDQLARTLVAAGRIELLGCGRHARIPTLPNYRIAGGNQSKHVRRAHDTEPAGRVRTGPDRSGSGRVRTGTDKSRSESVSVSESVSSSGPAPRRRSNGSKDPDEERAQAIARAQAKLDDPATPEDVKQAARFALARLQP